VPNIPTQHLIWCALIVGSIFGNCGVSRQANLCALEGKVIDAGGLDGCRWLIETPNGQKLLPQNGASFHLEDWQSIRFSYLPFDGMSACMAEDAIILLTCVQVKPQDKCLTEPWENITWLRQLVESQEIRQIDRYQLKDRLLYKVVTNEAGHTWYDCQGRPVCHSTEGCDLDEKLLREPITLFLAQR
jgi:hypothetical protein